MSAVAKPLPASLLDRLVYCGETGDIRWALGKCAGRLAGSLAKDGYRHIGFSDGGKFRSVLAHRVAWALYYSEEPPAQVDHVNRDRADNRIENLRAATPCDNARNRGPIRRAKYKGVTYDPSARTKKPWRAYLHVNKRRIDLGRYATIEAALEAYKAGACEHHGEFAAWE